MASILDHLHIEERNVSYNDALNIFYLWLFGIRYIATNHLGNERKPTTFQLVARNLLYAPSHGNCYSSCGALAGMRTSLMAPP